MAEKTSQWYPQTGILHDRIAHPYPDGTVNPPVQHASTLKAPDYLSFIGKKDWRQTYGRYGLQTHRALEDAVSLLENAYGTVLADSGLHAVSLALMSFARPGDHLLIADSVYEPVRIFADNFLVRMNVAVTYYNPLITPDTLEKCITPHTRILYLESPGSGSFEFQNTRALSEAAKNQAKKIGNGTELIVLMDNSWGAGVFHQPLDLGCDISLIAGTKYISGHSDIVLGAISVKDPALYQEIVQTAKWHGLYVAPDETYLALRGIRTIHVRLKQHQETALTIARWLKNQDEVTAILHPDEALHFGRENFIRDFCGAGGLFGFYLQETNQEKLQAFFDAMQLFSLGYSWGGYESLLIPVFLKRSDSSHLQKFANQTLMRIYAGLERAEDLIGDLQTGFAAMRRA